MGLLVALCSGKGGTGKSTTAAALALGFSDLGKSVVLLDLDAGLRCLDLIFGIDDRITLDIADILAGREVVDALYRIEGTSISLIPASANEQKPDVEGLADLIGLLKGRFDVVIADLPAGINSELLDMFSSLRAQIITVCTPDPVSLRDAATIAGTVGGDIAPRLIINRFDYEFARSGTFSNVDDIIDTSATRLLGVFPLCMEFMLLSVKHRLKPRSKPRKAAVRIARRLCGENVPLPRLKKI